MQQLVGEHGEAIAHLERQRAELDSHVRSREIRFEELRRQYNELKQQRKNLDTHQ